MDGNINIISDDLINNDYREDITEYFSNVPEVAKPLIRYAKDSLNKIERLLYTAPSFINAIRATVPKK